MTTSVKEKTIHPLLTTNWKGLAYGERLENVAGSGTPDAIWVSKRTERAFWLEYKIMTRDLAFSVRPSQLVWHVRWRKHGVGSFFLARNERFLQLSAYDINEMKMVALMRMEKPFNYVDLLSRIEENLRNPLILS